jgi:hypothetical protein
MKWITRENAAVDRIACPWLIKRFVDPGAEFLFVPVDRVHDVSLSTGAIPFDVEEAELGHVDGRCSFESILLKYDIRDAALARMAKIVHGADVPADEHLTGEATGLRAISHGFRMLHGTDDARKLQLAAPMYDALYAYCESEVANSAG